MVIKGSGDNNQLYVIPVAVHQFKLISWLGSPLLPGTINGWLWHCKHHLLGIWRCLHGVCYWIRSMEALETHQQIIFFQFLKNPQNELIDLFFKEWVFLFELIKMSSGHGSTILIMDFMDGMRFSWKLLRPSAKLMKRFITTTSSCIPHHLKLAGITWDLSLNHSGKSSGSTSWSAKVIMQLAWLLINGLMLELEALATGI